MKKTADVVIIGGGIMGASIAYHLALRGCHDILLLERADLFGTGSTGKNAGGIRHQFSTEVNILLSRHSIAMLERFADEMDQEIDLNFCGYLFLLDNDRDVQAFRQHIALQNRCGVASEFLGVGEIAQRIPQICLDGIVGGTFYDRDGLTDPASVLQGYVTQARRLGANLVSGVAATEIRVEDGRVQGVGTPEGVIATPTVVIAAGPWSVEVARLAAVDLPVQPIRRQLFVTRPIPEITRSFPFVIDFSRALYFHYESSGLLTGKSNPDQKPGFDESVDADWRMVHLEEAVQRMPLLEKAELLTEWAGLYEATPDGQPILGNLPHAQGLVSCTGFSGHGFMHGPISGLLIAEEILDGAAHTVNIDPLRWSRFEHGADAGEYTVV